MKTTAGIPAPSLGSLACVLAITLYACASAPQPTASEPPPSAAAETEGATPASAPDAEAPADLGFTPFPSVSSQDGGMGNGSDTAD